MATSKRDTNMATLLNQAEKLERLLERAAIKIWDFVIFCCTYQNDYDWEKFIARFLRPVPEFLQYYNGLDLLDKFAPMVLENRSFEGATIAVLRDHLNQWATTALQKEQGIQSIHRGEGDRHHSFIMVDEESLKSVLSAPDDTDSRFVLLV